jgi:FMN phosphatase YigB (HAD superfamily)
MKKKPVRFIYFDIGGVLLDWREGHKKVAKKYNVPYESIRDVFEANWKEACRGTLKSDVYMGMFAKVLGMKGPLPEVSDFWTDHFSVIKESHTFVYDLQDSYALGILSNAEENSMKYAFEKGLIPDVPWRVKIDSSKHGTIKPEEKIYKLAEQAATEFDPEELFFIDDVPEHIAVAKSRGWQGVVFNTNDIAGSIKEIKTQLGLV